MRGGEGKIKAERKKIQIRKRDSNHKQAAIKSEGIKTDRPPGNSRRIHI